MTVTNAMNIIFTLMFISIAYLFKENYPRDINSLIGYRTKRSMSSIENWLFANKFSSALLFKCSLILPLVQILLYILFNPVTALFGMLGLWVLILIGTIIITERKLKR